MVIGIEASRANRLERTGVEWYAYHVIQGLKKHPSLKSHFVKLYTEQALAGGLEEMPPNWSERRLRWPPKYLWTQTRLSWEMWNAEPNVLFVPAHVLPRLFPARNVVTVHDIGFHRYPELYKPIQVAYHEATTREIVKRCPRILTVSEFSKRELIDAYGAKASQVVVTPLAIDYARLQPASQEAQEKIRAAYRLHQPFFCFIGRIEAKKNTGQLIEAWKRLVGDTSFTADLVLAGLPGKDFAQYRKEVENNQKLKERIHFIGYLPESQKAALLSASIGYIHPAKYEGFGMPPLEALSCGTRVLCARAASLPEVVGEEQALWFDPHSVDALLASIHECVHESSVVKREAAEKGRAWVKRYQWETTVDQTAHALLDW